MAKITCKQPANFTGHIGVTAFRDGEAESDVDTALAFFKRHPDRFDVEGEEKPKRRRSRKPKADEKADDSGSDEQPEDAGKGEDDESSDNDGE